MPVMQPLAKVDASAMKCIDERGFHEPRFVDHATWMVIRTRRPFNHPVKDLELAELPLPVWDTFGAQVVYKGLLAGSRANGQQGTQFFIKQIPFLFETVESALRFFLGGLLHGKVVFVGEFLRHIFTSAE